jgi:predicted nucleic acid-binding protein
MGLIIDSSIAVQAERRGDSPAQLIEQIANAFGDQNLAISTIGLTEIVHAIYRSQNDQIRSRREAFIRDLLADIEVIPYMRSTAFLAGRIDGEQRSRGVTIPTAGLLIGATALELGYSVLTMNLRHFRMIAGLTVVNL